MFGKVFSFKIGYCDYQVMWFDMITSYRPSQNLEWVDG